MRSRNFLVTFLTALILQITISFAADSPIPANRSNRPSSRPALGNGVSIIKSSDSELTFQFSTGSPTIKDCLRQSGEVLQALELPSCHRLVAPVGFPDLPANEVIIGIPQTGNIQLQVTGNRSPKTFVNINLAPVPKQTWESTKLEKSEIYQQNRFLPGTLAEIKEIGFWRDIRVAKIQLSPVQYNPISKELNVFETLNVTVQFSEVPKAMPRSASSTIFDPIYEKMLLNGKIAKDWVSETHRSTATGGQEVNFFEISENWLKVKIETTGVYKITYQDLSRLGLSRDRLEAVNPKTFRLFNIGNWTSNVQYPDSMIEIPIYVYGESDTSFDQQDYILFWGEGTSGWDSTHQSFRTNYFTNYNYYWLTYGGDAGRRIALVSNSHGVNPLRIESARSKIHFEQDLLCPARSGLLWLWDYITKAADKPDTSLEISFTLPHADSLMKITFAFYQPASNLSANCSLYLNQTLIGSRQIRVAQYSPYIFTLDTLPPVTSDNNTLRIRLSGSTEMQLYVDWFDVEYRESLRLGGAGSKPLDFSLEPGEVEVNVKGVRQTPFIFDVTDKFEPKWISDFTLNGDSLKFQVLVAPPGTDSGRRYIYITDSRKIMKPISMGLKHFSALPQADYYIVTPDELYDAARLLERYRTNNIPAIIQGRAHAVKLSDIYDEYTFGIEEPGAIRDFFKDKQPVYGLLLGDGTYDYRNNLGFNDFPVMPPYETGFDFDPDVYSQAALAADIYYARFDEDPMPDMILGRVTARTSQEVRQFYEKVREYESKPFGFWNSKILLLADDEWRGRDANGNLKPDDGMIWTHIVDCDAIENIYKNRLEPVKVYLTEYAFAPGNEYAKPLARTSFIQALNQGALILCYFGHGAGWQLAHEKAFYVEEDVVKIHNERRNPFAFFGSCGVGRFEDTRFQAIAEELVRKEDGCIGTVGATKATNAGSNLYFANDMFGYFADTTHAPATIGQAFFAAWSRDYKYHLFGDPAVVLDLPELKNPIKISPDTFKLGELCSISDSLVALGGPSNYYLTAYGAKWFRTYSSYFYGRINTVNYTLPGFELFRGSGTVNPPLVIIPFIIPRGQNPNMRGDGYTEKANSAKVFLGFGNGGKFYPYIRDSIPISYDTTPRTDTTGPVVNLYADQMLIRNGGKVPAQFTLSGTIYDQSGILILPNTATGCSLNFFDLTSNQPVGLGQYFIYSNNSYTQGQFIYPEPINLINDVDTIFVIAYDCQLNRTEKRVGIVKSDEGLKISNALVYPNPVKTTTYFTFNLSKPAYIRINIYTINGRPVKSIPEKFCSFGYNQIEWDSRDDTGVLPANGVYLYQIKARFLEGTGQEFSSTITDKLLILR